MFKHVSTTEMHPVAVQTPNSHALGRLQQRSLPLVQLSAELLDLASISARHGSLLSLSTHYSTWEGCAADYYVTVSAMAYPLYQHEQYLPLDIPFFNCRYTSPTSTVPQIPFPVHV
jgi:hypothetical protein